MKAVVLYEKTNIKYIEIEDSKCGADEVRVRVKYCGICGSDIHKMQTKWKYQYPAVMGHEFSGVIEEIGDNVNDIEVGDNVVVAPLVPCNNCHYCKQGLYSMCENYIMIGSQVNGGFSENVIVPKDNIVKIGDLNYKYASFVEPLAVVLHAVLGIDVQLGDSVVVLGMGTIGMLTLQAVKSYGAGKIIAVDIDSEKLKLAKELGATDVINSLEEDLEKRVLELTEGIGADITLECAGSTITQEQALVTTRKKGKVGYLGIAYKDVLLHQREFENIFRKELTLKGFWNAYSAPFPGKEWINAIRLIKENKINVECLISHEYTLDRVPEAFDMILNKREIHNKVLIKVD